MSDRNVPSVGSCLETMAWLMNELRPVVNEEILAHLRGIQDYVRSQYALEQKNNRSNVIPLTRKPCCDPETGCR